MLRRTRRTPLILLAIALVGVTCAVSIGLAASRAPGAAPSQAVRAPACRALRAAPERPEGWAPERCDDAAERLRAALRLLHTRTSPRHIADAEIAALLAPTPPEAHPPQGLAFVSRSGPTAAAHSLRDALDTTAAHGVAPALVPTQAVADAIATATHPLPDEAPLALSTARAVPLLRLLMQRPTLIAPSTLADRIEDPQDALHVPELRAKLTAQRLRRAKRALELSKAEALMRRAASSYAAWMRGEDGLQAPRDGALLSALHRARHNAALSRALLASRTPDRAEYATLQRAFAHYSAIAQSGGWPTLSPHTPEPDDGEQSVVVTALRGRLVAEGLLEGLPQGRYDAQVRDALDRARVRYDLPEQGWSPELIERLNVPADYRAAQLALNLRRWRALHAQPATALLRLNVPSREGALTYGDTRLLHVRLEDDLKALDLGPRHTHLQAVADAPNGDLILVLDDAPDTPLVLAVSRRERLVEQLLRLTGARRHVKPVQRLNPHLPFALTYFTATAAPNGKLTFHDDLQLRDRRALQTRLSRGAVAAAHHPDWTVSRW